MNRAKSNRLYEEALKHIVGGVNSPSRSFKAVGGGAPVFMKRGRGAYFWDEDGNRYIDYLAAYGPIILGHAHPRITEAICRAAENGTLYGTPTELEIRFAKMLKAAIPSLDKVRFVNSGTEAVMTTIRVARAFTGRTKIIKFAGCYHGHSDLVLVAAGSGPSTLGTPDSAGVTGAIAREVITVPFNDLSALEKALERWGDDTAAVLVEPIVGNFGMVMPAPGFLAGLCRLARQHGALVIYDEVITAFRFHYGAAQTYAPLAPAGMNAVGPTGVETLGAGAGETAVSHRTTGAGVAAGSATATVSGAAPGSAVTSAGSETESGLGPASGTAAESDLGPASGPTAKSALGPASGTAAESGIGTESGSSMPGPAASAANRPQPWHRDIEPDLTALGKIIGGGLPIGAYGGRAEIMEQVAPLGPAYQAGTMAGNPASISAGIACLETLAAPGTYERMDRLAAKLAHGLADAAERSGISVTINRIAGSLSLHFCDHPVTNYEQAESADGEQFARFFRLMLDQGICLAPSKYEAWFLTTEHTETDIDETIAAAERAFQTMAKR